MRSAPSQASGPRIEPDAVGPAPASAAAGCGSAAAAGSRAAARPRRRASADHVAAFDVECIEQRQHVGQRRTVRRSRGPVARIAEAAQVGAISRRPPAVHELVGPTTAGSQKLPCSSSSRAPLPVSRNAGGSRAGRASAWRAVRAGGCGIVRAGTGEVIASRQARNQPLHAHCGAASCSVVAAPASGLNAGSRRRERWQDHPEPQQFRRSVSRPPLPVRGPGALTMEHATSTATVTVSRSTCRSARSSASAATTSTTCANSQRRARKAAAVHETLDGDRRSRCAAAPAQARRLAIIELELAVLIGRRLASTSPAAAPRGDRRLRARARPDAARGGTELKNKGQPWELAKAFDGPVRCRASCALRELPGRRRRNSNCWSAAGAARQRHRADDASDPRPGSRPHPRHFTLLPGDVVRPARQPASTVTSGDRLELRSPGAGLVGARGPKRWAAAPMGGGWRGCCASRSPPGRRQSHGVHGRRAAAAAGGGQGGRALHDRRVFRQLGRGDLRAARLVRAAARLAGRGRAPAGGLLARQRRRTLPDQLLNEFVLGSAGCAITCCCRSCRRYDDAELGPGPAAFAAQMARRVQAHPAAHRPRPAEPVRRRRRRARRLCAASATPRSRWRRCSPRRRPRRCSVPCASGPVITGMACSRRTRRSGELAALAPDEL